MRINISKISLITAVGLLLWSCVLGEDASTEVKGGPMPIEFGVTAQRSKGIAVEGTSLPNQAQFAIYAYDLPARDGGLTPGSSSVSATPSTLFSRPHSARYTTATGVEYGTKKYWSDNVNQRMKFFAVYPYSGTGITLSSVTTTGPNPYVNVIYTCNDNPSYHQDVMWAASGDISHEPVNLLMRHATTRLTFSARMQSLGDGTSVKIVEIRIKGISVPNRIQKRAVLRLTGNSAAWDFSPYTSTTDLGTYKFTIGNGLKDIMLLVDDGSVDPAGNRFYRSIQPDGQSIMIIPQPTEDVMIEVDLQITKQVFGQPDEVTIETNFFIPPESAPWDPGNHIHYFLTVAGDVIVPGAIVGLWDEVPNAETIVYE